MNHTRRNASRIPRAPAQGCSCARGVSASRRRYATLRGGHPWVFREALAGPAISEPTGAVVDLMAGNGAFVARGYVDRDHSGAVRVLSRDPANGSTQDRDDCQTLPARRATALAAARRDKPTALRLFAGESEGLPGVTVDRYADFVVVQWYSAGALPWREELLDAITEAIHPRGIYEQKRLRPLAGQAPAHPAGARAVTRPRSKWWLRKPAAVSRWMLRRP